jgi:hypothetical protein
VSTGLPRSVQTRLVRHAAMIGRDPNLVLARFAAERVLYRLSRSAHAGRFVLKGAMMLIVWLGERIRPTRDADLLGYGDFSDAALAEIFREVCAVDVPPDGLTFDQASIRVDAIRQEDEYGGRRVSVLARLGPARIKVQIDIGIGDAVFPEPVWLEYPALLDLPRPRLRGYQPATSVAEKLHAMVKLDELNSRMRDFFDVHALAAALPFDGGELVEAVRATFNRRATVIPAKLPLALTPRFARVEGKQAQWSGFVRKSGLAAAPIELADVVAAIAAFAGPPLQAVAENNPFRRLWKPGGPWGSAS